MDLWEYCAMGLHIRSSIPLAELPPFSSPKTSSNSQADVVVVLEAGEPPTAAVASESFYQLRVDGVGVFEITDGRSIRIWQENGSDFKNVRAFLFATVWASLCHQRGILPLHASAVLVDGGFVAFCGDQGVGKSTTAASLNRLGMPLAGDDIIGLERVSKKNFDALPFMRRSKLCSDSIDALGLQREEAETVGPLSDKWWVATGSAVAERRYPLSRLYHLRRSDRLAISRLSSTEAIPIFIENTHRRYLIHSKDQHRRHLEMCTELAAVYPVFTVERPDDLASIEETATRLARHVRNDG